MTFNGMDGPVLPAPAARPVAMTAMETPVFFESDLLSADRMTKPESQNTGIDVM